MANRHKKRTSDAQRAAAALHRPCYLLKWRLNRNLSQEQLGAMLRHPVDKSTIKRVEDGESPWRQTLIEDCAEALGVTPFEILFVDPDDPGAELVKWVESSPYGADALYRLFLFKQGIGSGGEGEKALPRTVHERPDELPVRIAGRRH